MYKCRRIFPEQMVAELKKEQDSNALPTQMFALYIC